MKIYFDGIIYTYYNARPGGISNFFDQLITHVSHGHDCLLTSSRPRFLPHPHGKKLKIFRNHFKIKPTYLSNGLERIQFAVRASFFNPDLIHATYYCNPAILFSKAPVVYTVYDMILEKYASEMDPSGKLIKKKKHSLERASALPCISHATRNDLLNIYPHLERKTSVIHLAGEPKFKQIRTEIPATTSLGNPYLLYVGSRESYKNFTRLTLAFAKASVHIPKLRLKVVGPPLSISEARNLEHLDIKNKVDLFPNLNDLKLYELYKNATAFVYPSLYEGFGIPPLEAMALGAPVLASNTSSIPEVTGNAALLFNPWSEQDIYDAIMRISINSNLRQELIERGKIRCLKFNWEKTSLEYMKLYKNVLNKK